MSSAADLLWGIPAEFVATRHDEVHVWRASLDVEAPCIKKLQQTLSEDERARAERFYFQKDRDRFIVARGLVRSILGRYLDIEPGHVKFAYGPYGKPALAGESGVHGIHFNLSHSDGLALCAIARGREVGVDLERLRPDFAAREIAERFFSPREVAILLALPENQWPKAFFNCWTRKEAYIKARGEGLTLPLDRFDVSVVPGEAAALLYVSGDPEESSRWSLQELVAGPGYVSALAVEGHGWRIKCWQWAEQ